MDVCVWVSACFHGKERIFSSAFLTSIRVSGETLLSILMQRPHKELGPCESARQKERTKDISELGVRLQSRELDIQAQDVGLECQAWDTGQ